MTAPFLALDFETADHGRDSACAVGVCRVEGGKVVYADAVLIRPPRRTFKWTHIHGLTWNDVRDADPFSVAWPKLLPLLDGCTRMVAHNASFDRSVLEACCKAAGLTPPALPWVCTLALARARWPKPLGNSLPEVCGRLGVALAKHHHAGADAAACAAVLVELERLTQLEAQRDHHGDGGGRAGGAAAAPLPVPGGPGGPAGDRAADGVRHPDHHPGRPGGNLHRPPDAAGAGRPGGGLRPDGGDGGDLVRDAAGLADRVRRIAADRGVSVEGLIADCCRAGVLADLVGWAAEWAAARDRMFAGSDPCVRCGEPTRCRTVLHCRACLEREEGAAGRTLPKGVA